MKHRSRTNRQNKNDGWDGRKSAAAAATLTLAHTLNSQLSLSHTLRDNSADVDVAVAALYNTVTFVLFIFSFRLLAWRFLIARISFHFISVSFRFRQRAHSLSLFLCLSPSFAYCATSIAYAYTLHTYNVHTDRAGGLQPINMSERQRRIYIFALYVCLCVPESEHCPVARTHSLQWPTSLI